jgi:hypothetical protein
MRSMGRRAFLGAAGLGAVAAAAGPVVAAESEEYRTQVRPLAAIGVGRGQAASLSVVFLPADSRAPAPPLSARLVLYELDGERLLEKEVELAPFTGASIEYELPREMHRRHVFGYVFVPSDRIEDAYAGIEVFDVASGGTILALADPLG